MLHMGTTVDKMTASDPSREPSVGQPLSRGDVAELGFDGAIEAKPPW